MSTPVRFSDGQYKNWLKCSQSLIIMKKALHDYTDNEVRKLHGDITQKVSSIPCASSTGNQCGSCSSKNIRLTGSTRNWFISCNNNICDKWLQQILAVHDNPHNPSINWKNADISLWPVDCYQVAKIFMPKGQDKTAKMPDDLDAPAILSLLKYCNWFRKDLPNTQILSDLIEIRNKVLHSGDLSVSDSDKDSWIDLMIQLLKDLKIHGDAISNLETLKKEDIDINFRETEIRLLQKMVSGLVNDINTVKDDMVNMENSVSDLFGNMEKVRDRNMETIGKVDAVNTHMEGIRKSLEELQVIYDKMVSFFDKNPDIHDKEITEKIQTIGMDVVILHSNLTRVETELQEIKKRVSLLEEKMEEMDERLAAVEEQKKHETELTRKKRPETEGLRQLKIQTENRLETHRKLECIQTKQAEKAEKLLAKKRSIVIKGNPGEGKTTMSLHLIGNDMFRDKRVVLNHPRDWEKVDTDWVAIVVLEDVFGQYDFDPGRLQKWMVHLRTIQEHVDVGKLQVIVTTRTDVLSKAYSRLGLLKLFSEELSLTLSSEQLTNSEKVSILNRELNRHKRNMKEEEIKECIANFGGLIGFPQCCSLFAGDSKSLDKGPDFFRSPKKFFVENIEGLEAARFLSLAFLFCNDKILEENLSSKTMPKPSKKIFKKLVSGLQISKTLVSIDLLGNAYDNFENLYIVKSMSVDFSLEPVVKKHRIMFTHSTVSEAVGHVLGKRCLKIVVKYGDPEYLYQRTYTAEVEDSTSKNVFLPVYVYGHLAERMVHDVVNRRLVSSVVKHSALKRHDFIKILKEELNNGNMLKDFYMAGKDELKCDNLSEGECVTFMQYMLQGDEDVVRLVYSELLEMLACAHNDNIHDCWRCEEKQNLLELALYYHHFEIADKLIARKACYTHVSLCNAAKHGDLIRVETITERLKENRVFNPKSEEANCALYRAYVSGNQSLIEFLLKEGIILDSWCVVKAVQHGDINVLTDVVKHLIDHKKWNPYWKRQWIDGTFHAFLFHSIYEDWHKTLSYNKCSSFFALYFAYYNEKFHIADYLLKNGVKIENYMLAYVSEYCSQKAVSRMITDLREKGTWDPKCDDASKALEAAICEQRADVYDLLVQNGISLKMKNLQSILMGVDQISLEYFKKVIQHMKDTDNWDPKCDDASEALEAAICKQLDEVNDLLVQNGVSIKMKKLPGVLRRFENTLESLQKVIQHMKDTDNWDPKCDDASEALEAAICQQRADVFDLLVQDGISLKMKNLPGVLRKFDYTLESLQKVIQHMKDTDNWDPKCDDASKALEAAICKQLNEVYDLLVQNGVSIKMKNLPGVLRRFENTLESLQKVIQHMKNTDNWDPKCDDASEALEAAICKQLDEVYDLLVQNGVSIKMKNLPGVLRRFENTLESLQKVIQHMKDTDYWDPKCDDASEALEAAICQQRADVFDLLVQNGISLKMKNLQSILTGVNQISLEFFKKVIQHMKDTDNWDPRCDDASEALEAAICEQRADVFDLLVQNGVSIKMKNFPCVLRRFENILESLQKVIQHMKDTDNWDPKCDDASEALEAAICKQLDEVYDLLVQNGVSIKMKNLTGVLRRFENTLESLPKVIQHMKDTDNWDPKCDDASEALEAAICQQRADVFDLLVQNGISLKMKNLQSILTLVNQISLEYFKKVIQYMKDTDNWDPKCDDASEALEAAICKQLDEVYDLLVQNGVSIKMKNLPGVLRRFENTLESLQKVMQHMKDTDNWDPKCDDASEALEAAICEQRADVFDLLVQDGISLKMKNLQSILTGIDQISLEYFKKVIQHMKDTHNWDPKCDDASNALAVVFCREQYDVYDLLVQNGVSLKMENLLSIIMEVDEISLESVKKVIQHLKETEIWDPKRDDASEVLSFACNQERYDVVDLLIQEGVLLNEDSS